jgi:putative FmdB family regulatory protein
MPIYRYECGSCGVEQHVLQAIGAEAPQHCGEPMAKRPAVVQGALAPWLRQDAEEANARAKAFIERPETKARLDRGELARGDCPR